MNTVLAPLVKHQKAHENGSRI